MPLSLVELVVMSRRSIFSRLLTYGAVATVSSPLFAAMTRRLATSWKFGSLAPEWVSFEIAAGDTLLVPAQIAGKPVRAVLDSGSGASIIGTGLAAGLHLGEGERRTVSGLAGTATVRSIPDVDVQLGQRARRLPFAVIADLSTLSAAFGRTIDMLLGADMFEGNCVALDFVSRRFALAKSGSFVPDRGWTAVTLERGVKKELFVSASVAGSSPVPLMIDLGSATALMLSSAYVDAHDLTAGRPISTVALAGVEGVSTNHIFTIPDLKVNGLGIADIPTIAVKNWLSTSTIGNMGLPLIAQFDVVFDVTARCVWLRSPASGRTLPLLKDRSGLGLSVSVPELAVVHVARASPAAKAEWAIGDRIIAVNGMAVDEGYMHGSLWTWRYDPAGTRVKLKTSAGDTRELELADYY